MFFEMKRFFLGFLWLALEGSWVAGSTWKWPDQKEANSIESKFRLMDSHGYQYETSSTTEYFREPINADGFYNRPEPNGRYPVHALNEPVTHYETDPGKKYQVVPHNVHPDHDGTLDSLQYCRCTATPDCEPSPDHMNACGPGKVLCCYRKSRKELQENFFDDDEEKATLLPGKDRPVGAFPPPPATVNLFSPDRTHDMTIIGQADTEQHKVPDGQEQFLGSSRQAGQLPPEKYRQKPTLINPTEHAGQSNGFNVINKSYLETRDQGRTEEQVAPPLSSGQHRLDSNGPDTEGFSREINDPHIVLGPIVDRQQILLSKQQKQKNTYILNNNKIKKPFSHSSLNNVPLYNAPSLSHGILFSESARIQNTIDPRLLAVKSRGVLVGPGGFTGVIGPTRYPGVLSGPGGPTGQIGPYRNGRQNLGNQMGFDRGVLLGPAGLTGRIGPNRGIWTGARGSTGRIGPNRGILTGPGGPTGRIGPDRGVLTGPGGPTGRIGPDRGVLTGPGGPTGRIGPDRGVLTGPGGPTGRIGPDRGVLTGPGGPTGRIGPERRSISGAGPERGVLTGPNGPTGRIGPDIKAYINDGDISNLRTSRSSANKQQRNDKGRYGLVDFYIETSSSNKFERNQTKRQTKPDFDGK